MTNGFPTGGVRSWYLHLKVFSIRETDWSIFPGWSFDFTSRKMRFLVLSGGGEIAASTSYSIDRRSGVTPWYPYNHEVGGSSAKECGLELQIIGSISLVRTEVRNLDAEFNYLLFWFSRNNRKLIHRFWKLERTHILDYNYVPAVASDFLWSWDIQMFSFILWLLF